MKMRYKLAIAGGVIGVIVAAAAAFAASPSAVSSAPAVPSAPGAPMFDKQGLKPVHSESEMIDPQGKLVTMIMDAGQVTDVTSTSLTIRRADGQSVTVTPDANTKIGRDHAPAKLSDIKSGDLAMIMQLQQNGTTRVMGIRAMSPAFQAAHQGRGFGGFRGSGPGFGPGFGGRRMMKGAPFAPPGA
ncbi:MAG: hypothetical protein ACYDCC_03640 [Actinomycetota bacterium]